VSLLPRTWRTWLFQLSTIATMTLWRVPRNLVSGYHMVVNGWRKTRTVYAYPTFCANACRNAAQLRLRRGWRCSDAAGADAFAFRIASVALLRTFLFDMYRLLPSLFWLAAPLLYLSTITRHQRSMLRDLAGETFMVWIWWMVHRFLRSRAAVTGGAAWHSANARCPTFPCWFVLPSGLVPGHILRHCYSHPAFSYATLFLLVRTYGITLLHCVPYWLRRNFLLPIRLLLRAGGTPPRL
jgi:hypothetical protein